MYIIDYSFKYIHVWKTIFGEISTKSNGSGYIHVSLHIGERCFIFAHAYMFDMKSWLAEGAISLS